MPFPPYNPRLRAFIRLDYNNQIIPGTSVLRKNRPKNGKWREITPVESCCFPFTELTYTPPDVTLDGIQVTISCDDVDVMSITLLGSESTDLESLVAILNDQLSYLGVFSVSGSDIVFKFKLEVSEGLCDDPADLSFTVTLAT